jgi:hypothetical protein
MASLEEVYGPSFLNSPYSQNSPYYEAFSDEPAKQQPSVSCQFITSHLGSCSTCKAHQQRACAIDPVVEQLTYYLKHWAPYLKWIKFLVCTLAIIVVLFVFLVASYISRNVSIRF